jgi:PAS domain S-box-containing protein
MSNSRDHSGQKPADATTLRQRAEEQARTMEPISPSTQTPEALEHMLHELRVHQIELEMQNEELRRAQAEIEDGRARYFDLYDLAPVGYCTLSEKGLILEANLTAATLLGVVRSALIKQPLSRFILKEDRDIYYLHRKHLFETGEPQQCELRLVKPDGAPFWAQLTGTAAQGQDGELVCRVVVSDIAGRKRVEDELQRNLTMLARTEHLANIGSWEWDIDADCTHWSEELFRIFQRDPALGAPSLAEHPGIYVAEDMERLWAAVKKCISNGTPYELELRAIRTDGMIRHCVARGKAECDEKGRIIRLVGSLQDITERKEAEKKLRKSESLFRTLVNTIPDLIWLKDAAGVYLVCNKRFERFFGASETEICGKTDYDFVDEEMADSFREHDRKALAIGGISRNEEQITDADDGHTIFLETIKTPMFDSDGNLVGVLGIGRDITERKQAEEAIKEANVVLAQKDALLQSMLHNLPFDFWARDLRQNMLIQSKESVRMWGDLTGTAFHEANLAPEYLEVWKATNARVLSGEIVTSEQAYVVCGEQRLFNAIVAPILLAGKFQGILGINIDITEHKQAEKALREKEHKLNDILDNAISQIWAFDGQHYTYFNKAYYDFTGLEPCERLSIESWTKFVHPEDLELALTVWSKAWETKKEHDNFFRLRNKTGEYRDFWCHAVPIFHDDRFSHFQGYNLDITDRKQAEAEREKLQIPAAAGPEDGGHRHPGGRHRP